MPEAGPGLFKQEAWTRGREKKQNTPTHAGFSSNLELERSSWRGPRWNSSTHEYEATSSHTGPVKGFPLRPGLIEQIVWGYGGPDS
ncbi:hypothetical protein DPEC_G00002100 [Dallia pectoralis]|uniref:Uncharacterized protein n=1 Tax=Dallia pectoralis TaxID=75939 RepID=A0ACC2HJQ8_DALPE|nr:hypothetical protein DPEC_G00002100 [Dallia pectoralis]